MNNWTKIDAWDLEDEANGAMLMIVCDRYGSRYLLGKLRLHPAMPATWCIAIRLLKTDTRKTLESDAGCNCPMPIWVHGMHGYDYERVLVLDWSCDIISNIAKSAK